ncbi:MAG: right-handed parallel beta-helix repeat-containing protein [Pirellulales bacterium]|nr:right-handed parallel beta-helix repeat-containing protein [Pirellulales bacterium]
MTRCLIAATLVAIGAVRCSALDVSILDGGAKPGGDALCTDAIQQAVDRVSAAGGGRVTIPAGVFKSGALVLKSGVELHLAEGAVLLGSTDLDDYPKQMTRIEGHFEPWRPALVNAKDLDGVRITGPGTLDGNGKPFWTAFWQRRAENPKCTNLEVERPRLVFLENCTNVEVRDARLKDSGFWNLHLYKCRDALVEGISIAAPHGDPPKIVGELKPWDETAIDRAPSSDGIDVDSCQNVTIRNCTISVGDDCIALKGTKGPLAMEDETSPPVENVLIEDCNFVSGHGVLTCGSEATIVRNVTLRNCRVGAAVPVVRLKLRPDTPQLYENIAVDGITADRAQAIFDVKPWTQFFDLQGHAPPQSVVRNVTVERVTGTFRTLGELRGNKGDEISGVTLRRIDVVADVPRLVLDDEQAVVFQQVLVNGQPYSAVSAAASSSR